MRFYWFECVECFISSLLSQWEFNKIQFYLSTTRFIRVHTQGIHTCYNSAAAAQHTISAQLSAFYTSIYFVSVRMRASSFLFPLSCSHLSIFSPCIQNVSFAPKDPNKYVLYYMLMCIDFLLLKHFCRIFCLFTLCHPYFTQLRVFRLCNNRFAPTYS